ncbi:MAG: ABC transporter permease [Actinomycetota bacterium]
MTSTRADAPGVPGPALRRGSSWLRIRAVARRHLYVLPRSPHRLFDLTIWPLVDVLLFGSLAVFVSREGEGLAAGYLLSGIVLWHVVYQSQIAVSAGMLEETWSRNIVNLLVTPLREGEYVLGVALFGLAKITLGVAVVALTALVFYAFDISSLGWGLIPIVAILLTVGWAISLFVIALILRFGSGAEALVWGVMFAVMPLSGVFYPVSALPALLQPIALALPPTHAFAAARSLVAGHGLPWDEVALGALTSLGVTAIALLFLLRMLRLFRRRGYISRYT